MSRELLEGNDVRGSHVKLRGEVGHHALQHLDVRMRSEVMDALTGVHTRRWRKMRVDRVREHDGHSRSFNLHA